MRPLKRYIPSQPLKCALGCAPTLWRGAVRCSGTHQHHRHSDRSRPAGPSSGPPPGASSSSSSTEIPVARDVPAGNESPLGVVLQYAQKKDYAGAARFFETHFDARTARLTALCPAPHHARDLCSHMMRVYTALGRMDRVRDVFAVALRDLQCEAVTRTPADLPRRAAEAPAPPVSWARPSLLNTNFFNMYLEVLTVRKNYDRDEVRFVLAQMQQAGVAANALTYHYLISIHIRAGYDPRGLWLEMREKELRPLPATVLAVLLQVVPYVADAEFVVDVVREGLQHGSTLLDKAKLAELVVAWLAGGSTSEHIQRKAGAGAAPAGAATCAYPPEYILWLMLELELRCVLDTASFVQYVQRQHVAELLLRCAQSADAETAERALALMDRHAMAKTADVLALVVWCWADAVEIEKAFDMVELMARKGYLDLVDPLKRYVVEVLRYPMERSHLLVLADALGSNALLERALHHLKERQRKGMAVSVHALDIVVLAACKLGEERRALYLVSTYAAQWGVQPRANTFNCLLLGNAAGRGTVLLRTIYDTMLRSGVTPNAQTFRTIVRQAAALGSIDEAIFYLEQVTQHAGLRVEVEMILPILERAARAGDVETVNRISQYSLNCDIGIDANVLNSVMTYLTEAGESVEVLKGHQPLHDALRTRSSVGRQRARNEIAL
ncbi:hypothetical protein STCU_01601 [Strigomonas culicis]|uniref:Pentacotripeptide-repeat region of PRORP domain-containing protein n=1 Tax=Strigomonas culicis TaxID=28005 RepID=S9V054_9TRYP|nr:hypothetical protein STCU_01601 [Strigomonas culicis]|eukprot:EPY34404.1 hypothetical protein STCU_01601 [Strigomonas culicis]